MKWIKKFIGRLFLILVLFLILSIVTLSLYPLGYKDYINKYSKEYGLDPFLIAAIINVESKYDKNAVSIKDAKGLMQIGPKTGQWASEELDINSYNPEMLFDPDINIKIGTWYLNKLNSEFENNLDLVLAAYNGGSGNVQKWRLDKRYSKDGINLDKIPFKETEEYLRKVKFNYKIYKTIYSKYMYISDDISFNYVNFINYIRKILK